MKRLILFDIDGTILSTHGAAKRAFHRALLDIYGTAGPIDTHRFDGKTDPQIARELLNAAGMPDPDIDAKLDVFWPAYLGNLEAELARPDYRGTLYPGVVELLDALDALPDTVLVGLLTGNVRDGARLKLASFGLADRFRLGAYGSDHERRDCLPEIAVERAREIAGADLRGHEVVVIGDTPSDVTCGRRIGVRAVAVATGSFGAEALHEAGADVVLRDLSDTAAVLTALALPEAA